MSVLSYITTLFVNKLTVEYVCGWYHGGQRHNWDCRRNSTDVITFHKTEAGPEIENDNIQGGCAFPGKAQVSYFVVTTPLFVVIVSTPCSLTTSIPPGSSYASHT